ncbi:MAG: CdvA-like protein [Thermoprotei archaeon]
MVPSLGDKFSDTFASPSKHLGKTVKDEYNRVIGWVAGFFNYLPEEVGQVSKQEEFYFVVQTTDGFHEIPSSRVLSVSENHIIVKSELKQSLKETKERIEWLYERIRALEEASSKDDSAPDAPVLTAAQFQHKVRFNSLVESIHPLLEVAQRRVDKLLSEIELIERAMVDLNIARTMNELCEQEFDYWSKRLKDGLNSAHLELSDLDDLVKSLSRIEKEYRDVFRVEIMSGTDGGK